MILQIEVMKLLKKYLSNKKIFVCKSKILKYELSKNKIRNKAWKARILYESINGIELNYNSKIKQRAIELKKYNIKEMDALHIAIAEWYNIDAFITTDRLLINAVQRAKLKIKVMNPIDFWEVLSDE